MKLVFIYVFWDFLLTAVLRFQCVFASTISCLDVLSSREDRQADVLTPVCSRVPEVVLVKPRLQRGIQKTTWHTYPYFFRDARTFLLKRDHGNKLSIRNIFPVRSITQRTQPTKLDMVWGGFVERKCQVLPS